MCAERVSALAPDSAGRRLSLAVAGTQALSSQSRPFLPCRVFLPLFFFAGGDVPHPCFERCSCQHPAGAHLLPQSASDTCPGAACSGSASRWPLRPPHPAPRAVKPVRRKTPPVFLRAMLTHVDIASHSAVKRAREQGGH